MESFVRELLDSPNLARYKEEIDTFWAEEQRLRKELMDSMVDKRYEFINGKVIEKMPNSAFHNLIQSLLSRLLSIFVDKNKLGRVGVDKMMISLTRNDYEPDVCFWNKEIAHTFEKNQVLFPAPDFIAEIISKATQKRDRGIKFTDYANHGVFEYWLIDPEQLSIEQYKLYQGKFEIYSTFKQATGTISSFAVEGFSIPVKAIFDETANLEVLHRFFQAD